jgi:hypothetical protein
MRISKLLYPYLWELTTMESWRQQLKYDPVPALLASGDEALNWLIDHQQADGLWKASYGRGKDAVTSRTGETRLWISLAVCRVLRRVFGKDSQA